LFPLRRGNPYQIGVGGGSNTAGGDTWFFTTGTVLAKGGASPGANGDNGALGGQAAASIGDVKYSGGNGGNRGGSGNCGGCAAGAGGSGAGSTGSGNNGADGSGSGNTASDGGVGVQENGGAGGNGAGSGNDGSGGLTYGGGGGGAKKAQIGGGDKSGGNGAQGLIRITYCAAPPQPSAIQGDQVICGPGTYVYFVPNSVSALDYTWSIPAGWVGSSTDSSITVTSDGSTGTISVVANSGNCGSSIPQTLTVNAGIITAETITQTACNNFTFNGQTYTQSGTYTGAFTNITGCDSVVTLQLTINNINVNVNQNGSILTAAETGATYKWAKCQGTSLTVIAGATSIAYQAPANGQYAVIISKNGCTDTSTCYAVSTLSVNESDLVNDIKLFPNPASSETNLQINSEKELGQSILQIIDLTGRIVVHENITIKQGEQKFNINTETLKSGVYLVQISNGKSVLPAIRLLVSK
jgi:hypothetical protein